MRRMKRRPFMRRVRDGERGAVMTIFAVLVAGGVVMGMLALTIDVGYVMAERRQLQNAADATSLALASRCANDPAQCDPDNVADLLDLNSRDAASGYDSRADALNGACGRALPAGSALTDVCLSSTDNAEITDLRECPPIPTWLTGAGTAIPYVETYSRTESTDGSTILPKFFSQLLSGGGPDNTVHACARAAWGPPGDYAATIPLTISTCEWDAQTASGTDWVTDQPVGKPGYGGVDQPAWPGADREIIVRLHDPGDDEQPCDWNGKDTPGGFGWVDNTNCQALVSTDGWVNIDTGNDVPADCKSVLPGLVGTTVSIPVFNCIYPSKTAPVGDPFTWSPVPDCNPETKDAGGANSWYHIEGWAKFYVSGYRFSGLSDGSIMPGGHTSCEATGGDRCLFGWFLKGELDADSIAPPGSGGTDFGTYVVLPAG
jgi:hypothetical protein